MLRLAEGCQLSCPWLRDHQCFFCLHTWPQTLVCSSVNMFKEMLDWEGQPITSAHQCLDLVHFLSVKDAVQVLQSTQAFTTNYNKSWHLFDSEARDCCTPQPCYSLHVALRFSHSYISGLLFVVIVVVCFVCLFVLGGVNYKLIAEQKYIDKTAWTPEGTGLIGWVNVEESFGFNSNDMLFLNLLLH